MRISDWSSDVCSSDLLPSSGLDIIWHPLQEHLLDKLGEQLLSHVAAHKVKRLFIDGLGGFERAALHRPRLMEFFAVLTARLRALGVTTMATWERSEEHTSELQSLMRISYAVFCLKKKNKTNKSIDKTQ